MLKYGAIHFNLRLIIILLRKMELCYNLVNICSKQTDVRAIIVQSFHLPDVLFVHHDAERSLKMSKFLWKRILAVTLSICLILSSSAIAFADDLDFYVGEAEAGAEEPEEVFVEEPETSDTNETAEAASEGCRLFG